MKRISALLLSVILVITAFPIIGFAADEFEVQGQTIINDYLSVSVGSDGRFTVGTTGGNPESFTDDDARMLFGWPGTGTSYTTIVIDGNPYIFGSDYSEYTQHPVFDAENGAVYTTVVINDIEVKQTLKIIENISTGRKDVVEIKYDVKNTGSSSHNLGVRIMLDTMLGDNDHAPFRIPGVGAVTTQTEYAGNNIPAFWQAFDSLSSPKVVAQGSFLRSGINRPDKVQFTNWGEVSGQSWGHIVTPGEQNGDSAVCVIWEEKTIAAGSSKSFVTHYGLSELIQDLTPPLSISVAGDSTISVVDGKYASDTIELIAYIQNIGQADSVNTVATISFERGSALSLASNETAVKQIDTLSPGQEVQVTWKVKVKEVSSDTLETITFSVYSDNADKKSINKMLTLPAVKVSKSFFERILDFFKDVFDSLKVLIFGVEDKGIDIYDYASIAFDAPGLESGFIPQGICYIDSVDMYAISGYMEDENKDSRIYFVNPETGYLKNIVIDGYNGHAGGIAGNGSDLWISSGGSEKSNGKIYHFNLNYLLSVENGSAVKYDGYFEVPVKGSALNYSNGTLWVAEFYKWEWDGSYNVNPSHHISSNNAWACGYKLPLDTEYKKELLVPNVVLSIPNKVQGLTTLDNGEVIFSTSHGRKNDSDLEIYEPYKNWEEKSTTINGVKVPLYVSKKDNLITKITMPTLMEGIDYKNGNLYVIFESGAKKYSNAKEVIKHIWKVDIAALLEFVK